MSPSQSVWPPVGSTKSDIDELKERLSAIERKIDKLFYLSAYVEEHERMLCGKNGDPGLRIRVDRAEQALAAHKGYLMILAAGIIGAFLDILHKALGI